MSGIQHVIEKGSSLEVKTLAGFSPGFFNKVVLPNMAGVEAREICVFEHLPYKYMFYIVAQPVQKMAQCLSFFGENPGWLYVLCYLKVNTDYQN